MKDWYLPPSHTHANLLISSIDSRHISTSEIALGDGYQKFYQTLNNAKKTHSIWYLIKKKSSKYSFKELLTFFKIGLSPRLQLSDRYRKFYKTLNNAKKTFNSIYSIQICSQNIHSKIYYFFWKNWLSPRATRKPYIILCFIIRVFHIYINM